MWFSFSVPAKHVIANQHQVALSVLGTSDGLQVMSANLAAINTMTMLLLTAIAS